MSAAAELPGGSALPAVLLAAWGTAALEGRVSLDTAADSVSAGGPGHHVVGLDERGPLAMTLALSALRRRGTRWLRVVLPAPGDVTGLPGPADVRADALDVGAAVVAVDAQDVPLAVLVPCSRAQWQAHLLLPGEGSTALTSVSDAEQALAEGLREATAELSALDLARWRPEAADLVGGDARMLLPPGTPGRAHRALARGLRVLAIVDLATRDEGGAATADEMARRRAPLTAVGRLARAAVVAAANVASEPAAAERR